MLLIGRGPSRHFASYQLVAFQAKRTSQISKRFLRPTAPRAVIEFWPPHLAIAEK